MALKVLFLDPVHPVLQESLEKDGFSCEQDYSCTSIELAQKINNYIGLVIRSRLVVDANVLKDSGSLKFIARSGSGLENIDVDFASQKGIHCLNSPEGNCDAVGEHAVGLILALLNHIPGGDAEVRKGQWNREQNRGLELGAMTVGIIGYGHTGSAFAKKLTGFGCRILAHDKYKSSFGSSAISESSLEQILEEADIVSLHLPYNKETHFYFNSALIGKFRNNIFLINTSRGKVVCTDDLVKGLKEGKVRGAAMDVLEFESHSFEKLKEDQLPDSFTYLKNSGNIVLSPHVAGWTAESYYKLSAVLYQKIKALNLI